MMRVEMTCGWSGAGETERMKTHKEEELDGECGWEEDTCEEREEGSVVNVNTYGKGRE